MPNAAPGGPVPRPTVLGYVNNSTEHNAVFGINKDNLMVGEYETSGGRWPVRWSASGVATVLDRLFSAGNAWAEAINSAGTVVGTSFNNVGTPRAVRCASGGQSVLDLEALGGAGPSLSSYANALNFSGVVVGKSLNSSGYFHAYRTSPGGKVNGALDLGSLVTDRASEALGINDVGDVVGSAEISASESHAFLYSGSGPMRDINSLGGNYSKASGINLSGVIVGEARPNNSPGTEVAFVVPYPGANMQDLNNCVNLGGYWVLKSAEAIDDSGRIAGWVIITITGEPTSEAFCWSRNRELHH